MDTPLDNNELLTILAEVRTDDITVEEAADVILPYIVFADAVRPLLERLRQDGDDFEASEVPADCLRAIEAYRKLYG